MRGLSVETEDLIEKLSDVRREPVRLTYEYESHSWTAEIGELKGRSCSSGGAVEALHRSMKRTSDGPKLGIMGFGVVGDALHYALTDRPEFLGSFVIFDPGIEEYKDTSMKDFADCKFVFICVPTPPMEDGSQDISIVEKCLTQLAAIEYKGIVVIRSTTTPENVILLSEQFESLRLLTNPEFLTEAHARYDTDHAPFHVVGGDNPRDYEELVQFYKDYWPTSSCLCTTARAAMFMKYLVNSTLALRVSFMNEAHQVWENIGDDDADWNEIRMILGADERLGLSHTKVPGPDGKFGFGGKCFPKDVNALIKMAERCGASLDTLKAAVTVNNRVREPEES